MLSIKLIYFNNKNILIFILFIQFNLISKICGQENFNINYENPDYSLSTKDGLLSNKVYGVIQDKLGFLYFFTDKGISKYDGHKFRNFTAKDGLPNQDVWLLSLDSENRLWIHTHENTLTYLKDDHVHTVKKFDRNLNIRHVEECDNGELIFHGVISDFKLTPNGNNFTYEKMSKNTSDYHIDQKTKVYLYQFNKETICLTEFADSLYILDSDSQRFNPYILKNDSKWYSPQCMGDKIYCSSTKGLLIFEKSKLVYNFNINSKIDLNRSLLDNSNNYWTCTKSNGIQQYIIKLPVKKSINLEPGENIIYSFQLNNDILILTNTGYFRVYSTTTKKIEQSIYTKSGVKIYSWFDNYLCIQSNVNNNYIEYKNNNYVLNKKFHNLDDFDKGNLTYALPLETNFLNKDSIIGITHFNYAAIYYTQNSEVKVNKFHIDSFRLKFITIDSNNIYLFTKETLYHFNREFKLINTINLKIKDKLLTSNAAIIYSKPKSLIIATESFGLYIMNQDSQFIKINGTENLKVRSLSPFGEKIIAHSNNGIYIISYDGNEFNIEKSITNEQGIVPESIINVHSNGSELIIVTQDAIHYINPDSIPFKTYNLRITEIYQGNNIKSEDFLKSLPHDFKPISISLSLLDFQISKDVAYQYNLNDNEWQTLAVNTLDLSDLASGSYNLNLRAINKYSNKLLDSKILKLNVLRPCWKTWQFILLINAFLISSIIWGYRKWLNRRNEIKINIRNLEIGLREYKMKALESQMNPHFVYNSLASIQYFIQENKNEEAEHFLTEFGILIRSFLTASRSSQINLKIELELLQKFINLEQIRFSKRFTSEIIIDPKLNLTKIFIPPLLLQPFIENAIQHGLFHRLEGGQLKLNFEASNRDLIVTISDNGIGTEKSKSLKKFSLSNTTSDAMEIFLEKLEIMNKLKPNSLEYSISNLDDTEPYYVGTKIVIIFKNIIVS